jgi:hypothetical protein
MVLSEVKCLLVLVYQGLLDHVTDHHSRAPCPLKHGLDFAIQQ